MAEVGPEYAAARERGDFDIAGVIAGEACASIHDIPPAGEIVERTVREAEPLLKRLKRLLISQLFRLLSLEFFCDSFHNAV